jgi:signal transduction histidine kinase
MKLTKQIEAAVLQAYYDFWSSNLSANMEMFSSYLVDDFSIFGSANGEVFFNKHDAVKFYTATGHEMRGKAELRNRNISVQPLDTNSVIVREECDLYVLIENEWTFYGHARISCIVKHIDGGWKALHQHTSFPDHRTEEGQQLASEKIEKENLELREAVKRRTVELESKNRELEIEAALERVRSRTMAMQHSDELIDAATVLFQQIEILGAPSWNCSFNIWGKDKKYAVAWNATKEGFGRPFNTPSSEDVFLEFYTATQEGKDFFTKEMGGSTLALHYEYLATLPGVGQTLAELKLAGIKLPDFQVINIAYFAQGYLMFITYEPVPQLQDTFKRFAKVFEQAYTRFLDLQKAEAQAKESQIQLALERVRARTMAMQHSDELAEASFLLDSQVRALGIKTQGCAFNIYGETDSTEWFSSEMGAMPPYKTPRENLFLRYYEAGEKGESIHIEEFAGEACTKHYEYLCTVPGMGDGIREMLKAGGSLPTRQIDHAVYFKYGYLLFLTLEPVPEAHDIFIRFAKVFEQTYTRFLDLQTAEAQTLRAEQDLIEIKSARKKAEDALTELQLTQKQLIQSEKMASLGELTAGIAHEIQNPLNFVNNFSEVSTELVDEMNAELAKGDVEEAKVISNDLRQNLEKISNHGKRAADIVKGMLQHSRSNSGVKEPTDIGALADEYLRLAYHGLRAKDKSFNAYMKTDFDVHIGKIDIVPQDMGRVILNLITNAFYVVAEKKQKRGGDYEPTVTVSTKSMGDKVLISVKDNGNGIPQKVLEKIFQPFFTTKPAGQGTGLGLSMSYDIVTKTHNGEIKVETKEGEGTEFIVILPRN